VVSSTQTLSATCQKPILQIESLNRRFERNGTLFCILLQPVVISSLRFRHSWDAAADSCIIPRTHGFAPEIVSRCPRREMNATLNAYANANANATVVLLPAAFRSVPFSTRLDSTRLASNSMVGMVTPAFLCLIDALLSPAVSSRDTTIVSDAARTRRRPQSPVGKGHGGQKVEFVANIGNGTATTTLAGHGCRVRCRCRCRCRCNDIHSSSGGRILLSGWFAAERLRWWSVVLFPGKKPSCDWVVGEFPLGRGVGVHRIIIIKCFVVVVRVSFFAFFVRCVPFVSVGGGFLRATSERAKAVPTQIPVIPMDCRCHCKSRCPRDGHHQRRGRDHP